jgi:colanic acid biosynthesis glycosyl transferase WcaI
MRIFVNEFCGHPFQLELSRELAKRGHDVCHVFFADNDSTPKGRTHRRSEDSGTLEIEGLHIRGVFSKYSLLTRRQADIQYGNLVADKMERFHPDVVVSANMPLDGQKILQEASRDQEAKFVFWMQDVYSVAVRFVLNKEARYLARLGQAYYEHLEKQLLRQSDAIVCIAPSFKEFVFKWGITEKKLHVINNWAPLQEIVPTPKENAWARAHGVADRFCFMYSGTLGMKHRPELLLELGRFLQGRDDAHLIVIAGGAGADWLAARACELRPGSLTLLPFQPYERLSEVMGSADVLITLLDSEAGEFAVPSKVLAYLCSGRALIIGASKANEAAKIVERANAGVVVSPDSPNDIVRAAKQLVESRSECSEYGRNARAFAERTFTIESITDRFLAIFAACVTGRVDPQPTTHLSQTAMSTSAP